MLEVRVHHSHNCGIAILPPMKNGAGQTALPLAHDESNARIVFGNHRDDFGCSIATVIVDNQNFVVDLERIKYRTNPIKQVWKIARLTQCRYGQR